MPRSGSGACSLAEAPFIPNTPISSADTNSNNDDIISMLTDSLSRSGDGGMEAVLKLDNTGFTYTTDPNTGMRRTAGDTQAIECGGVDVIEMTPTGATVNGDLEVTGNVTIGGNALLLIGEVKIWTSTTIPAKWLLMDGSSLLRASYPDLWTFAAAEISAGNTLFTNGNGTTTFTIRTMAGYAPVGVDASGTTLPSVTHIGDTTGNKTATLITGNLPAYTPSGSVATTTTNGTFLQGGASDNFTSVAGSGQFDNLTKVTPTQSSTFTGAAQGGTSAPLAIVQPSCAFKFIIYAGA